MDTQTKVLLVAFAALAGGVALGWYLRLGQRRGRMTTTGKPVADNGGPVGIALGTGPTSCGCRS